MSSFLIKKGEEKTDTRSESTNTKNKALKTLKTTSKLFIRNSVNKKISYWRCIKEKILNIASCIKICKE